MIMMGMRIFQITEGAGFWLLRCMVLGVPRALLMSWLMWRLLLGLLLLISRVMLRSLHRLRLWHFVRLGKIVDVLLFCHLWELVALLQGQVLRLAAGPHLVVRQVGFCLSSARIRLGRLWLRESIIWKMWLACPLVLCNMFQIRWVLYLRRQLFFRKRTPLLLLRRTLLLRCLWLTRTPSTLLL
ncbi:unnamed protein product [Symbiodinium natans]|uniref:Uncharacterized protein n=1 Tax=Symbiodinium natans TaxID=878477 RepID=A0A812HLK7_9DINO|nr:unnamed protein product [Symbiodinium natans]